MGLVHIYYGLLLLSFAFSLFFLRYPLVKWLGALFFISIVAEAIVEIIGKKDLRFFVVYHFFVPAEYLLVTLMLRETIINRILRRLLLYSVFVFSVAATYFSLYIEPVNKFPSITGNIEGALIIGWCILSLLSIRPVENLSIYQLPVFWVCLGFMIYFLGSTTINSLYNYLLASHSSKAKNLFAVLNSISNYLLYIFLIIGIYCHKWETKSSAPLSPSR